MANSPVRVRRGNVVYRSRAENALANWLNERKIKFDYETIKLPYTTRVVSGFCDKCGNKKCSQRHVYLLDFWFPKHEFGIELKGRLTGHDRDKMVAVKRDNPEVNIKMLFLSNNRLHPRTEKRYMDWAAEAGYDASVKIPDMRWFG
jgi:hypothetical protein